MAPIVNGTIFFNCNSLQIFQIFIQLIFVYIFLSDFLINKVDTRTAFITFVHFPFVHSKLLHYSLEPSNNLLINFLNISYLQLNIVDFDVEYSILTVELNGFG